MSILFSKLILYIWLLSCSIYDIYRRYVPYALMSVGMLLPFFVGHITPQYIDCIAVLILLDTFSNAMHQYQYKKHYSQGYASAMAIILLYVLCMWGGMPDSFGLMFLYGIVTIVFAIVMARLFGSAYWLMMILGICCIVMSDLPFVFWKISFAIVFIMEAVVTPVFMHIYAPRSEPTMLGGADIMLCSILALWGGFWYAIFAFMGGVVFALVFGRGQSVPMLPYIFVAILLLDLFLIH